MVRMPRAFSMLAAHGKFAGLALLILIAWGSIQAVATFDPQPKPIDVDIGVEHQSPLAAISFASSTIGSTQWMDIGNGGSETLLVSVPASWVRTEVRDVPLASVTSEEPAFGYTKWTMPAGATVTFETEETWQSVTIHNPSEQPLRIRVTRVDLATNDATYEVYLATNRPVKIW
jgi:hypothetical protein